MSTESRVVPAPGSDDLDAAAAAVSARLAPTPLVAAPKLGRATHLKLETLQPTGSFKIRGALAALARLRPDAQVVTASAGNHGLGVAWAATELGVAATVVVPATASPAKLAALERFPIRLERHGSSYDEAELRALELAAAGAVYLSAYNDTAVIAGQATVGREIGAALSGPLTVVCSVGGGGLASGLGLWAASRPGTRVVAVESERSPAFSSALAAGRIVPITVESTLADGLAGNLEPDAVTFELVRDHVETVITVSESEIEDALRFLAAEHGLVVEGAAAVAVAGARSGRMPVVDGETVVVLSGRNIALPRLAAVLAEG